MTDIPQEDLLGYLLGLLDANEHARLSALLEFDSVARQWAELLRRRMGEFAMDREHLAPPGGLAIRSCHYVRRKRSECGDDDASVMSPERSWLLCAPPSKNSRPSPLDEAGFWNRVGNWFVE